MRLQFYGLVVLGIFLIVSGRFANAKDTYFYFKISPQTMQDISPRVGRDLSLPAAVQISKTKYKADLEVYLAVNLETGMSHAFIRGIFNARRDNHQWEALDSGILTTVLLPVEDYAARVRLAYSFAQREMQEKGLRTDFSEPTFPADTTVVTTTESSIDLLNDPIVSVADVKRLGKATLTDFSVAFPPLSLVYPNPEFEVYYRISRTEVDDKNKPKALFYRRFFRGTATRQPMTPEIEAKISGLLLLLRSESCRGTLMN